jgi:hypothetical protein
MPEPEREKCRERLNFSAADSVSGQKPRKLLQITLTRLPNKSPRPLRCYTLQMASHPPSQKSAMKRLRRERMRDALII